MIFDCFVISNTFHNCDISIFNCGANNRISNNLFKYDLLVDDTWCEIWDIGYDHVISNNTFINSKKGIYRLGIYIFESSGDIIEGNEFNGYRCAISILNGWNNNIIFHNNFINNIKGISLGWEPCINTRVINNNFINNDVDASSWRYLSFGNIFDGNYWDEWIGLKIPILGFLPYVYFNPLSSFIDRHPAKEPNDITSAHGCGIV